MTKFELWSATPTPFADDLTIDKESVQRLMQLHESFAVDGVMLCGSCGEGPWMPCREWYELMRVARESVSRGSGTKLAVQVTDNSTERMLTHIRELARCGADYAAIASPYFQMNATVERIYGIYFRILEESPIPIIYYDRGQNDRYRIPDDRLANFIRHPNLHVIKDSSLEKNRAQIGFQVRQQRADLTCLTGDEFNIAESLRAGFDGGFLGGAIFIAPMVFEIFEAAALERWESAKELQEEMNAYMLRVYGGPNIESWLTGLKYYLVRLGIFLTTRSYLEYPLTDKTKIAIDALFEDPHLRARYVDPLTHQNRPS